jgi:hypothetical protein
MDFKHFNKNARARYRLLIYCLIIPTAPTTVILKRILNTMTRLYHKIPLLNKSTLILGGHALSTPE